MHVLIYLWTIDILLPFIFLYKKIIIVFFFLSHVVPSSEKDYVNLQNCIIIIKIHD